MNKPLQGTLDLEGFQIGKDVAIAAYALLKMDGIYAPELTVIGVPNPVPKELRANDSAFGLTFGGEEWDYYDVPPLKTFKKAFSQYVIATAVLALDSEDNARVTVTFTRDELPIIFVPPQIVGGEIVEITEEMVDKFEEEFSKAFVTAKRNTLN